VDGTIQIEKLDDVLYVGRPTYGQANSQVELFKIVEDGEMAIRVPVRLGRASVDTIEVIEGLVEGDQVILSDTSQYDDVDRIKLE
jgi:HlyD family secretion protein